MLKPQKWTIPSQSGDIEVQFTPHNFSGRHELYIGGNKIEIPRGVKVLRETGGVVEIPFSVDSAEYRFVIYPGKADIVYDGRWLSTGKPYTPPQKPSAFALVFAFLCFACPVISLGGALPAAVGAAGFLLCLAVIRSRLKNIFKVLLSLLISLCCIGFAVGMLYLASSIGAPEDAAKPKTFEGGNAAIELTDRFLNDDGFEDFDLSVYDDNMSALISHQSKEEAPYETPAEYAKAFISTNSLQYKNADLDADMPYFEYTKLDKGDKFCFMVGIFEDDKDWYIVQFQCFDQCADDLRDTVKKYLATVTVR